MPYCKFCDQSLREKEGVLKNRTCIFLSGEGYNPKGVLVGSGVIITLAHKETPFDLTEEEMKDTLALLKDVKDYIGQKYRPDGYSIGWNVGKVSGQAVQHVHLHIMLRYDDEPLAGKGIRHFLKRAENARAHM